MMQQQHVFLIAVGLMVGLIPKSDEAVPINDASTTAAVVTTQAPPDEPLPGPWDSIRLPLDLTPSLYKVDLKPFLTPDSEGMYWFDGVSEVTFMVAESTNYIYIHSYLLKYSDVKVVDDEGTDVGIATYSLYLPYQYLVVEMNSNLVNGKKYTLMTTFRGELSDGLGGLYRSSYTDDAGNTKVLATTQMQPTDARKAFPCFDEPAMKAEFDILLWHKDPNYAISNQPNMTTSNMDGDWKRTTFERTLKMSTYLLAFVVCDFDSVEGQTDVGKLITATIYARADQVAAGNADYAKDITPNILEFYQDYFSIPYPLPKSDQMAVPDFNAGAMENWGLVIYRETALLYNPAVNSASNKQRVAAVVAHELAHQWFGNLITPQWWDELWLNEGFASYLEYLGTDHVEPTWGMSEQFLVSDFQRALEVDALTSSHPIVVTVNTPAEINEVFDTISYSKGACLIRMINSIVGDVAFKQGLTNYINAHKYGSVTHEELFVAWEDAITDDSIKPSNGFQDAMSTFTLQMGFPLVTMTRTSSGKMEITQERFLIDQEADPLQPPSPFNYKWDIPFQFVQASTSASPTFMWLPRDQSTVEIEVNDAEWIIGNYKTVGYFRVNYDVEDWNRITTQLQNDLTQVDTSNRGQLLNDAFTLARTGKLDYGVALELTRYLVDETEYIPWESALDSVAYFDLVLSRSKTFGPYSEYLLDLTTNLYNSLGWDAAADESILTVYNRINAISVKCFYGDDDCAMQATTRFDAWMTTATNDISPDLKSLVYCNAVRYGKAAEWDFMWDKYLTEKNSQEKSTLSGGLTCSREPWINQRFLTFITNDTYVRKQDASGLLERLCGNDYARDLVWDYIRQNWDFIYETYGSGSFSFSGIIESCTAAFSTPFELSQLQDFLVDNADKLGSGERAVQQALEQTQTNINWRANYEEDVFVWMADYVSTT